MTIDPTSLKSSAAAVAQSLSNVRAQSTSGATTATSTPAQANGATISSNDFLSLLVTEMKNQDPTQPTDPNAYIQQLVGVNSLQQLIAINQDLTPTSGAATGSAASARIASAGAA